MIRAIKRRGWHDLFEKKLTLVGGRLPHAGAGSRFVPPAFLAATISTCSLRKPDMKRIPTGVEIIFYVIVSALGGYLIDRGASLTDSNLVTVGAFLFTGAVFALACAGRNLLWHWSMLRDTETVDPLIVNSQTSKESLNPESEGISLENLDLRAEVSSRTKSQIRTSNVPVVSIQEASSKDRLDELRLSGDDSQVGICDGVRLGDG
jgi:hypothetical protein